MLPCENDRAKKYHPVQNRGPHTDSTRTGTYLENTFFVNVFSFLSVLVFLSTESLLFYGGAQRRVHPGYPAEIRTGELGYLPGAQTNELRRIPMSNATPNVPRNTQMSYATP
jgi:hypothetical protein